ncbi:MAG: hypothetical protein HC797_09070 [Anaerolineales bacterium]|nr:hypothetical protein [Anaerolineales bacterium]
MRKNFFFLSLLVFTLACALPRATRVDLPQQPADLNALQTIIVQTADAAQTQTAIANPTFTQTSTSTPTRIPSITPSPTVTFIFLLPSLTPIPTITPIGFIPSGSGGGTPDANEKSIYTGQPWSCRVTSTQPPIGAIIQAESTFYAYWTILNTGTTTWTRTTVDIVYTGGWRHEGTKIQDFSQNVATGGKIVVGARFIAPKRSGEYGSHFVLKVGNRKFCGMEIAFEVPKK